MAVRVSVVVLTLIAVGGFSVARSETPRQLPLTFDVASVKRSSGEFEALFGTTGPAVIAVRPGGRFWTPAATVRQLLRVAYSVEDFQIVGGPAWLSEERFEIEARTRSGVTAEEAREMVRALLRERFGLVAHRETRQMMAYLLVHARSDRRLGNRLRRSAPECAPMIPPRTIAFGSDVAPPPPPPPPPPPGSQSGPLLILSYTRLRCGNPRVLPGHLTAREITLAQLATILTTIVGRPVVDRAGLADTFDVDLTYAPDGDAIPEIPIERDAAPLATAIREQLGLRLESSRASIEVVVVDSIQPPTEN